MKAPALLAALMLASAVNLAHAKPDAPPTLPPQAAEQALGPLIDAFLESEPDKAKSPPGPPDLQSHAPEWKSLVDPQHGNAYGHTDAIPEPDTYALMLAGLGMLFAIGRRLKDKGTRP